MLPLPLHPLPLPLHPFDSDCVVAVRAARTIYVRFDGNDYTIPPEAAGRPLTLAASGTEVRILDEALERNTPRSSSVAFLLRQCNGAMPLPLDLSRHPQAQILNVHPHDLKTYDELAHRRDDESESYPA